MPIPALFSSSSSSSSLSSSSSSPPSPSLVFDIDAAATYAAARRSRSLLARLHLFLGLCFGTVLVLLGLTGSAIAWLPELDAWLNPALLRSSPQGATLVVTPATVQMLTDRLAADLAYGKPEQLTLPADVRDVFVASWRRPVPPDRSDWSTTRMRQVMIDPYTLQINGERDWGEFGWSRPLLMPSLFHWHRYLLAGDVGKTIVGITGLALLAMALSGLVLWWPCFNWSAVLRALRIVHGGSWSRLQSSLHRAGGFFAAPVLALLAFSGIYFNLPQWVVPAVAAVAQVSPSGKLKNAAPGPQIGVGAAMAAAQQLYPAARVSRIVLPAKAAQPYQIRLRQQGEVAGSLGATRITLDAVSAKALQIRDPLQAPSGDRFLGWLFPLHSGQAFGSAGKIFISLFGLLPLVFFVTGVLMWRKRTRADRKKDAAKKLAKKLAEKLL